MEWLKMIAPTIATAVGGPFGTMAYGLIAHQLKISPDDAKATIEAGKLTADQIASVQLAEIEIKAKAQELGLNFEQLAVADRKSARDMQITTQSKIPPMLAVLIVIAWATIQGFLLTHVIDASMRELVARVLGTLDGALMLVLSFYFGSSSSSDSKDSMLHQSTPVSQ
jgi:hypothetical protein